MLEQATFFKLNEMFGSWLILNNFLGEIESQKPIFCLYQELIKMSLQQEETKLLVSYKYLKDRLNFRHDCIRKALIELEKFKLVKRGVRLGDNSFYIELTHDFWLKELKGII